LRSLLFTVAHLRLPWLYAFPRLHFWLRYGCAVTRYTFCSWLHLHVCIFLRYAFVTPFTLPRCGCTHVRSVVAVDGCWFVDFTFTPLRVSLLRLVYVALRIYVYTRFTFYSSIHVYMRLRCTLVHHVCYVTFTRFCYVLLLYCCCSLRLVGSTVYATFVCCCYLTFTLFTHCIHTLRLFVVTDFTLRFTRCSLCYGYIYYVYFTLVYIVCLRYVITVVYFTVILRFIYPHYVCYLILIMVTFTLRRLHSCYVYDVTLVTLAFVYVFCFGCLRVAVPVVHAFAVDSAVTLPPLRYVAFTRCSVVAGSLVTCYTTVTVYHTIRGLLRFLLRCFARLRCYAFVTRTFWLVALFVAPFTLLPRFAHVVRTRFFCCVFCGHYTFSSTLTVYVGYTYTPFAFTVWLHRYSSRCTPDTLPRFPF